MNFNDREIEKSKKRKRTRNKSRNLPSGTTCFGRDPKKDTSWLTRCLTTEPRSAVFKLGTFYQLRKFQVATDTPLMPYPHNLLASENYAPFLPV